MNQCDAKVGEEPGTWGFLPIRCGQTVAVQTYITTGGLRVGFCPIEDHEANVRRRFSEQADPPEPEWDMPDSPEYADSMTFSRWFAERVR